jgi:outer membrane protein, multidrug efflux system
MADRNAFLLALALALAGGGCTVVGPDYSRPQTPAPAAFHRAESVDPKSIADLGWWELFRDPALTALIEQAIAGNLDVQLAASRVNEARTQITQARAGGLPSVSTGVDTTPTALGRNDTLTSNFLGGLFVNWEIDFWGKYARATEAARASMLANEESRRNVVASLVAGVAQQYFQIQTLAETLVITRRTADAQRESLRITGLLARQGLSTDADVRQAESQLFTTENRVPSLERQLAQAEHALAILLGTPPRSFAIGDARPRLVEAPAIPTGLPSALLERRPDIRQAEQQLVAANARVGEAKAKFFPSITLTGAFGRLSTSLHDLASGGPQAAVVRSLGADVLLPLYSGGALTANYDATLARLDQAVITYRKTILVALQEVSDSLVAYERYGAEVAGNRKRIDAAREVLRLGESRFRAGVTSYLEVLDAQRQLLAAETDLATSALNERVAVVQLYKALGGGWTTRTGT